jgi:hypothetical protein
MALAEDLTRIAALAARHGDVTGVLAAELTDDRRLYLVSFGGDDDHRGWLVLDDQGTVVEERDDVRAAASIIAMSELVAELAGAGDAPRLATPAYLDEVGGGVTDSLPGTTGVVQSFVEDVVRRYLAPLG